MDKLPFFYYDILARIAPGGVALAAAWFFLHRFATQWDCLFHYNNQDWKTIVIPILIGGACYVAGLLFEIVDYLPGMASLTLGLDSRAFIWAWGRLGATVDSSGKVLKDHSPEFLERFRFQLWDSLVLKGGGSQEMAAAFAHCHRFQAEYKMFLHLAYVALCLTVVAILDRKAAWIVGALIAFVISCIASHLRNRRRWLQALAFLTYSHQIEATLWKLEDAYAAKNAKQ